MKETEFNGTQEPKEESIDVKELLFKYLLHWPWFVGAVHLVTRNLVSLGVTFCSVARRSGLSVINRVTE